MHTDTSRAKQFLEVSAPCQRRLYAYIVLLVGDTTAAHDILQDTNLVLWQKFDEFQLGTNFLGYAKEVARYRVLRYRQIHSRDAVLLEPAALELLAAAATQENPQADGDYREALAGCVGKLSDADAELIRRRYEPGFQVRDFARRVGRSENALSQSLVRIRRLLRLCIERNLAIEGMESAQ
jgi:RNA polymerase sigma-70 factor (ECF subfamily)